MTQFALSTQRSIGNPSSSLVCLHQSTISTMKLLRKVFLLIALSSFSETPCRAFRRRHGICRNEEKKTLRMRDVSSYGGKSFPPNVRSEHQTYSFAYQTHITIMDVHTAEASTIHQKLKQHRDIWKSFLPACSVHRRGIIPLTVNCTVNRICRQIIF